MKEHPIRFIDPMVRAILDGAKTQTRRVVKGCEFVKKTAPGIAPYWRLLDHPKKPEGGGSPMGAHLSVLCPYGQPGDRLWVRENFSIGEDLGEGWEPWMSQGDRFLLLEDGGSDYRVPEDYVIPRNAKEMHHNEGSPEHWRQFGTIPSIFMPRWASRILLEITAIRVERLQDITSADCVEEGYVSSPMESYQSEELVALDWYRQLWESLNGFGSWAANPWVWVIEFKRV